MGKIRVLHVIETIKSGGVERRRLSLAKYLDKERFELMLIGTQAIGPLVEEIKAQGIKVHLIGKVKHPLHWARIQAVRKVIRGFQPHIIHGAVFEGVSMALISGTLSRVPIIIGEETSDPQNRSRKADYLLQILALAADRMVAISPDVANYLKLRAGIPTKKVVTISNGIESPRKVADQEINQWKKQFGIEATDCIIGSVGRLRNPHKRFTDIISALAILDNSQLKLLIVGEGVDKELIQQHAHDLGVADQLIWAGFHTDTAPFYCLMDIFCIASSREGFGLVAAEAMCHGLPVVATAVGGLKEIIVDGHTGLLVPLLDPPALASALAKLIDNPSLRQHMGQQGRIRAKQDYSAERYVREVAELYEDLVAQKGVSI
ncbi:glycosyltransferase [Penaeicola halotolerans]|uniref:glycosyltransferase n=1 Tax=Penaeicola halotolerans TaxID=2793196 RepID=UPI001CF915E2|nr:glycosyltransferase [Penaeicola halotolerans]